MLGAPGPSTRPGDHVADADTLDLAAAAAAAPLVAQRTGFPTARILAGLTGGRPLTPPDGCSSGGLVELARAASAPGHHEGDAAARALTAAALLRTFGLQAHVDRALLRQVLQVAWNRCQLTIPVHGGAARLDDGESTSRPEFAVEQPWDAWEVAAAVGTILDLPLGPIAQRAPGPDEINELADDVSVVLAAGATFSTPEAAATVTALADAVIRLAEAVERRTTA